MTNFSQDKRESAADLCMAYLTADQNFSDKTATIALALAVELLWSEEDLTKLVKGDLTLREAVLWVVRTNWDNNEDELAQPFVQLKQAVEGDIERYSDSVDWIFIKRLWNGCLTKLGFELLPEEEE
tara:strand:- start:2213 stop:2590 length:378 start_codon:yes stop_codon:yes gene_type:complete